MSFKFVEMLIESGNIWYVLVMCVIIVCAVLLQFKDVIMSFISNPNKKAIQSINNIDLLDKKTQDLLNICNGISDSIVKHAAELRENIDECTAIRQSIDNMNNEFIRLRNDIDTLSTDSILNKEHSNRIVHMLEKCNERLIEISGTFRYINDRRVNF
jgi:uncharacterized protein YoxC